MKNFSLIFLITLIFFLIVNLFIVLTWPIYSKINSNKHTYIQEQKDLLNLSEENLIILYNESWRNYDKFRFVPFIGHSETDRTGKFVNFNEINGRKINRPNNCSTNVILYGGSTTFGYNVTDEQTIGQFLQNLFDDDVCVFNHGRAYYYSKQENNLFINHIENRRKIDHAIFLDGINERCGGYEYSTHINNSFNLLVERPYLMWKRSFKYFVLTLPIVQFANSIIGSDRWIHDDNNNIVNIESCGGGYNFSSGITTNSEIDLKKLYQSRLNTRNAVCKKNNINCLSFLQPMAGLHGVQIEKLLSKDHEQMLRKKYKIFSSVSGLIELGYVFENDKTLSYIDGVHYSPDSNKKIALEFYNYLK